MGRAPPWRLHYAEPTTTAFATAEARTSANEGCHLHRSGRCANRIVQVVVPAQRNTEGRVDGVAAVHPDLVDQGLE